MASIGARLRELAPAGHRRWREFNWSQFVVLAAVCVCAGGLFAFARIMDEVAEGETHGFDQAILLALRNPADRADPIGPLWLEIMMRDYTSLGSHAVLGLMGVLAFGYLMLVRKHLSAGMLVVSFAGGMALNSLLKFGFARPRPDLVAHLVEVHTASFPSGHAMLSAVCYLTLGALLAGVAPARRYKTYILATAIGLTLLVGASRIYLGVHWPTDVLAGWCLGAAWAMACWLVVRGGVLWMQRRADRAGAGQGVPPPGPPPG
ncbi:phosphatase PAP2 family protein [Roseomonas haemaphysalidis]|uniref:Phosphatase PAP2 family protein n=1 Tax=Roseomonas haemaphysalidis TaxID=2768162 RepID=A0ABS3KVR8_9PROT|nr:phosphatase PAP2 family protein [Roseomonas haemaphysalidis]MBO1081570.1 phosphatase PAP2 family protein [Roseomonas haemaphysalidis]